MAAKFEIYRDKSDKFRFRLKAENGEIILSSQAYTRKSSCRDGIASVRRNAANTECFVHSDTADGKHRFNVVAPNRRTVGSSQNYSSKSGCENGVKSAQRCAPAAIIVEV